MEIEKMSCIDCAVKNCDKEDKAFPEFCVTDGIAGMYSHGSRKYCRMRWSAIGKKRIMRRW